MKKRKDGRYCSTVTIDGKKHFVYGESPKEVEVNKKQFLLNYNNNIEEREIKKHLLTTIVDEWYSHHLEEISENTKNYYASPISDVKEYFANKLIDEILPRDISTFLNSLLAKKYAKRTISARLTVLKLVYKYAIINNMCDNNPALVVSPPNIG